MVKSIKFYKFPVGTGVNGHLYSHFRAQKSFILVRSLIHSSIHSLILSFIYEPRNWLSHTVHMHDLTPAGLYFCILCLMFAVLLYILVYFHFLCLSYNARRFYGYFIEIAYKILIIIVEQLQKEKHVAIGNDRSLPSNRMQVVETRT